MPGPLTLIAAVARNGVIGGNNQLLWQLPEDMAHFRQCTAGATVIMGRKTWESLPERFRPLPGRRNLVVTRQAAYCAPGSEVAPSLDHALLLAAGTPERAIFVIGGGELYALALPRADRLLLTEVDSSPSGDTHFPPIDPAHWQEVTRQAGVSANGLAYAFVTYQRKPTGRTPSAA